MDISTPGQVTPKLSAWTHSKDGDVGKYVSFFNLGEALLVFVQFVNCKFCQITF